MIHEYTRKPKVSRKPTKLPTYTIQVASPPFLWSPPNGWFMLRGAFFSALNDTRQLLMDRDVDCLQKRKTDITGLKILRKEDLADA